MGGWDWEEVKDSFGSLSLANLDDGGNVKQTFDE